jgi:hypothetical protein
MKKKGGYFLLRFVKLNVAPNRLTSAMYVAMEAIGDCLFRDIEYPPTGFEITSSLAVSDCAIVGSASVTFKYT